MRTNEVLLEFYLDGYGVIDFYEETTLMVDCRKDGEVKRFPIEMPFVESIHKQMTEEGIWLLHVSAVYLDENGDVQKEIRITDGFRNELYETLQQVKEGTYESEWIPPAEKEDKSEIWDTTALGKIFENGNLSDYIEMPWKAKGTRITLGNGEETYILSDEYEENGYCEALKIGEFSKEIIIRYYDNTDGEFEYLVEICFGEDHGIERIFCKTYNDFLEFLNQLKPIIDGIQHDDILVLLDEIKKDVVEIIEENDKNINKKRYNDIFTDLDYIKDNVNLALKTLKRKNFALSDINKKVINAKKRWEAEKEANADIKHGRVKSFNNVHDLIADLKADD